MRVVILHRTAEQLSEEDRMRLGCEGPCVNFTWGSGDAVTRMTGTADPQDTVDISEIEFARIMHVHTKDGLVNAYLIRLELSRLAAERLERFKNVPHEVTGVNLFAFLGSEVLAAARVIGPNLGIELVESRLSPAEFVRSLGLQPDQVEIRSQLAPSPRTPI